MKTLGIIGGLGPESTVDYYQRIIALYRERTGDGHYPEFVIVSIDLRKGLDFMEANDLSGMGNFLLEAIGKLARGGADFGIISANTPHIVFDEITPKSPIPLMSIVEATCAAAKAQNLKRLALFGTRYTMRAAFYPKAFVREGIELFVPERRDQEYIHDKYMVNVTTMLSPMVVDLKSLNVNLPKFIPFRRAISPARSRIPSG